MNREITQPAISFWIWLEGHLSLWSETCHCCCLLFFHQLLSYLPYSVLLIVLLGRLPVVPVLSLLVHIQRHWIFACNFLSYFGSEIRNRLFLYYQYRPEVYLLLLWCRRFPHHSWLWLDVPSSFLLLLFLNSQIYFSFEHADLNRFWIWSCNVRPY